MRLFILGLAVFLSACTVSPPKPPTPDRTNIHPINDAQALEIIQEKVNHK